MINFDEVIYQHITVFKPYSSKKKPILYLNYATVSDQAMTPIALKVFAILFMGPNKNNEPWFDYYVKGNMSFDDWKVGINSLIDSGYLFADGSRYYLSIKGTSAKRVAAKDYGVMVLEDI